MTSPFIRLFIFVFSLAVIRFLPAAFPYWTSATEIWRTSAGLGVVLAECVIAAALLFFVVVKQEKFSVVLGLLIWVTCLNLMHTEIRTTLIGPMRHNPSHSLDCVFDQMRARREPFLFTVIDSFQYLKKNHPGTVLYRANENTVMSTAWIAEVYGGVQAMKPHDFDSALTEARYRFLLSIPHRKFSAGFEHRYSVHVYDEEMRPGSASTFFIYDHHGEAFLVSPEMARKVDAIL